MEKVLTSELPPAYCTLNLPPDYTTTAPGGVDHPTTEPLIGDSFKNQNARIVFTQKVFSIFVLQLLWVDLILTGVQFFGFSFDFDLIGMAALLYLLCIFVMGYCDQIINYKSLYNKIILVFYLLVVTFVILVMPDRESTILAAWLSYIIAGFAVLLYTVFSINCKYEFRLRNSIFIASGAFFLSYTCSTLPTFLYTNASFSSLYVTFILYLHCLYVLYDIDAMTKSDYRVEMTPDDYVNGGVNIHIDYVMNIRHCIRKRFGCTDE